VPSVGHRHRQQQLDELRSANRGGSTARQARQTRSMVSGFFVERSLISERTAEALTELRRQGRPWNHAPFGCDVVNGRLVANPAEQSSLARIRQLRAAGVSYRSIAAILHAEGRSTKRGGPWQAASVRSVFRNGALLSPETCEDCRLVPGGKLSRLQLDEKRPHPGAKRTNGRLAAATPVITKCSAPEDRDGVELFFDQQHNGRGPSGAGSAQKIGSASEVHGGRGAATSVRTQPDVEEPV
jgi:hypothetical protein